MKPEKHLATEATENNRGHREKSLCYSYAVLSVNPDVTTDMTTSHLTNPAKTLGKSLVIAIPLSWQTTPAKSLVMWLSSGVLRMKLIIVSVGHKMPDWITAGFNEYTKRIDRKSTRLNSSH